MATITTAVRYGIVGLISTGINYALFIGGIWIGLHYLLAATIGSAVTVVAGYFLNRTFTFAAPGGANIREFLSFLSVFALQYVLAMSGYVLLIGHIGMSPSLAFIINTFVVTSVAFTMLRLYTFRGERGR